MLLGVIEWEHWEEIGYVIKKWSDSQLLINPNTVKYFVTTLSTNCLNVFDHFAGLAVKGLNLEQLLKRRKFNHR